MSGPAAVVIGGGFFGVTLALHLAARPHRGPVVLIEAESRLLHRASRVNQARVHNGHHYPRAYTTAYRSRQNFPRFVEDYRSAVRRDFRAVYAVAREDSKVSARAFQAFCRDIGAPLEQADPAVAGLFDRRRIEGVFLAQEHAFDHDVLRSEAEAQLRAAGVDVRLQTRAVQVSSSGRRLTVSAARTDGTVQQALPADVVLNCTYSRLNSFSSSGDSPVIALRHELTEVALVRPPAVLAGLGVTVMDGPFFSLMPYPSRGLHSLTHVRYTPHRRWEEPDAQGRPDPQAGERLLARLQEAPGASLAERMLRDAERYLPAIRDAEYRDSLYEVKTIARAQGGDGRPILWLSDPTRPGYHAVLGAKLDNVYDLLETLDRRAPSHA